jgi:NAD(P)H dehydrogenase (quinone)
MVIAVSGATGQLGGRVARLLSAHGVELVLLGRNPAKAPVLPEARFAHADFTDPDSVERALADVETFFFVSATESQHRAAQQRDVVEAAARAGVQRVVYVSFVNAAPDCTFTFGRDHYWTEQAIRASGMAFTFLRDNLYQDVIPHFAGPDGVIRGPAGDGRIGAVSREDVAQVAAAVLLAALEDAQHDGVSYDVTGPRAFTLHEAAEILSEALGRPISYHPESLSEAYESRARFRAQRWEVDGWVTSYAAAAAGELDVVTDVVERLTGRPATDFRELAARLR